MNTVLSEVNISRRKIVAGAGVSLFVNFSANAVTEVLGPVGIGAGLIEPVPDALLFRDFSPFMDPTDPTETPIDCIDGRIPEDITTIPGAKLAGGWVSIPSAFALCGINLPDHALPGLVGTGKRLPFIAGGHIDTDHIGDGHTAILKEGIPGTGCGASDKQVQIISNFKTHSQIMLPIVRSILGADFSSEIFNDLTQTAIYPTHDARSLVAALAAEATNQEGTIDVLRAGGYPDGLNENHGHHESFVLINTVSGKTLNNAKLAAAHPHVQAFCVDLWFLRDIAEKLYPNDEYRKKQYLHALVAYQVATYYTLANGKQLIAIEK